MVIERLIMDLSWRGVICDTENIRMMLYFDYLCQLAVECVVTIITKS